jgi:ABC-2 type transport system permease protein
MSTLLMLIRREFWEHRGAFIFTPAAVCVLYLALCIALGSNFEINALGAVELRPVYPGFHLVMDIAFTVFVYIIMAIVAFFYLCDSLYTERKDRTILFWKSLPVSDTLTVLSKLLTALVGAPLVAFAMVFVTNLLATLVFKMVTGFESQPLPGGASQLSAWFWIHMHLLIAIFIAALWSAPVAAYQLLISVSVPRVPVLWTILPPLAIILTEGFLLGSWNAAQFVGRRLSGVGAGQPETTPGWSGLEGMIEGMNSLPWLTRPALWIGVAVAAVLLFAAIRIRRHRSDS